MKHISIKPSYSFRHSPPGFDRNRRRPPENHNVQRGNFARRYNPLKKKSQGITRKTYVGTIYPNGEFTIGYVKAPKKLLDDSRYERGEIEKNKFVSPEPDYVDYNGNTYVVPHEERIYSSLALSTARNCHTAQRKYGKNGITPYGKRVVRNCAESIQRHFGRKNTGFFTLTVPDYPPPIRKVVYRNWAKLQKKYFQTLRRYHDRHGYKFAYVSVTEVQSRRWAKTGNPGLHIHYCCPVYKLTYSKGDYLITCDLVREIWQRLLQNLINTIPLDGVEYESPVPRVDVQRVKSSCSSYLSKYMSKGGELIGQIVDEEGEEFIPSQWWSVSQLLKKWYKANRNRASADIIDAVFNLRRDTSQRYILYMHEVYITSGSGRDICVALSGRFSEDRKSVV